MRTGFRYEAACSVQPLIVVKRFLAASIAFAAFGLVFSGGAADHRSGQANEVRNSARLVGTNEVAVIKTSVGTLVAEFWPEVAPKTVEHFKKLAKEGVYDGTAFHRILKGALIQGGDPLTKDPKNAPRFGQGDAGIRVKSEFNERAHVRGVLSMVRLSDPDYAGSQFLIILGDAPYLDRQHTAFGKLIKGEDVLRTIGDTPVGPDGRGEPSKPRTRIDVQSIRIVPGSAVE